MIDRTVIRFLLVGMTNTLIGTSVMFISYNALHFPYWISSALNYIVGSIVSYYLNKNYTFKYRENDLSVKLRFICNIAVCYLLAYGIAKPMMASILINQSAKIRDNAAMLTGVILFTILNYFSQKYLVFRKLEPARDADE